MSAALPDPLEYAAGALSAAGALVDRDPEGWIALLPPALAEELGAGEECRLTARAPEAPHDDIIVCGLGTPFLERLLARHEGTAVLAGARLDVELPRASQARALGARFAVRNAPSEPGATSPGLARYLIAWLAWSAEADDRYDGLVQASVCLDDRGAPGEGLLRLADPLEEPSRLGSAPLPVDADALRRGLALAAERAEQRLTAPLAEVRSLVARRLRRDHERIAEYFEQLARDARAARRKVASDALEAKLAHLRAERDAKLRALGERYRMRVSLAPVALLAVEVPTQRLHLQVRRRKLTGELQLRLAPGADAFDALACAACPGTTARPAVCDDRLHVLCEQCVPSAEGRPGCAACRREG